MVQHVVADDPATVALTVQPEADAAVAVHDGVPLDRIVGRAVPEMHRKLGDRTGRTDDVAESVVAHRPVPRAVRVDASDVVLRPYTGGVLEQAVLHQAPVGGHAGNRRIVADLEELLVGVAQDAIADHRRIGIRLAGDLDEVPPASLQSNVVQLEVAAGDSQHVADLSSAAHRIALNHHVGSIAGLPGNRDVRRGHIQCARQRVDAARNEDRDVASRAVGVRNRIGKLTDGAHGYRLWRSGIAPPTQQQRRGDAQAGPADRHLVSHQLARSYGCIAYSASPWGDK